MEETRLEFSCNSFVSKAGPDKFITFQSLGTKMIHLEGLALQEEMQEVSDLGVKESELEIRGFLLYMREGLMEIKDDTFGGIALKEVTHKA